MALKDNWIDLEDKVQGDPDSGSEITVEPINKIAHAVIKNEEDIDVILSLRYYGDATIKPTDNSYFRFVIQGEKATIYAKDEFVDGDIVIPYKCTLDEKEYIINRIGEEAFFNCSNLTNVIIPNSVVRIRDNAFYNCKGLTKVVIPDSVIQIDDWAFEECSLLKEVTLSENISTIALSAFKGCSNLTDVYYKGSPEDWNLIQIGSNNEALLNATIHYNWKNVTQGYVDEKIGDIDAALEEIHNYAQALISGGET